MRSEAPLPESCDLLVAGGGLAGVMAALGAAAPGRRVVLIEASNVLGGEATAGGVAGFCGDTERVNDPFRECLARLAALGAIEPFDPTADRRGFVAEWLAFVLQEMAVERGVEVLFHSLVIEAQRRDNSVETVTAATPVDLRRYAPRFVVDATGSCRLAERAGGAVFHEGALRQLPMSLYFTLWDTGRPVTPILPPGCPSWSREEDLPMTSVHLWPDGRVEVKMKVIGFDAADGADLSRAEMTARRQMAGLIFHLQTKGYAGKVYRTHALASVSRAIGIREQKRLVGEHVLTEEEVTHGAIFLDAIAVGTYHLDYHWPDQLQRAGTGITTMVEPYHIPFRSLRPPGSRNLLVAGRGASGDQMAMSSFRVMATCAQMGFAAGRAVHQALVRGVDLADLSIPDLQRDLEAHGQALNLSRYGRYLKQRILMREFLFDDDRPFLQCHASSIAQLDNGVFFAVWFGGTHEKHPDVAIWGAARRNGRWSPPRRLAKVAPEDHWNPVLYYGEDPRTGDSVLHLWFKVGPSVQEWRTWHMVSRDQGEHWTNPECLPGPPGLGWGPVKNKPIRLNDGTLLAGLSDEPPDSEGRWKWIPFVQRSPDGGWTWEEPVPVPMPRIEGYGLIQPALWESAPGQVHMCLRSTDERLYRSDSEDGGRRWCEAYPCGLPNNNSGLDVARTDEGLLVLVCNPVPGRGRTRTPLSVLLSPDNGRTWTNRLDLETAEGEYSYPAVISTPRGPAITWTWKRERVAFWHGSVEQIPPWKGAWAQAADR